MSATEQTPADVPLGDLTLAVIEAVGGVDLARRGEHDESTEGAPVRLGSALLALSERLYAPSAAASHVDADEYDADELRDKRSFARFVLAVGRHIRDGGEREDTGAISDTHARLVIGDLLRAEPGNGALAELVHDDRACSSLADVQRSDQATLDKLAVDLRDRGWKVGNIEMVRRCVAAAEQRRDELRKRAAEHKRDTARRLGGDDKAGFERRHGDSATGVAARDVQAARRREPVEIDLGPDVGPEIVARAAYNALREHNEPPTIFVRGGKLTRVLHDEDGRARAELLSEKALNTAVMHAATFRRHKDGKVAHAEVPRFVAPTIATLPEWPGLPALAGIVEAPVLRPDGSVLQEPGYDPATRLYYRPADGLAVPDVKPQPTPAEAVAAARLLREELVGDFPFVAEADAANALALLLTPIVRQLVPLAPLALITAPIKGSGKGLLAGVAARIATGVPAQVYTYHDGEDVELRKAITAMLEAGASFVMLDEVKRLRSAALAAALTSETWTDRRLGQTEMLRLPQRATWVAVGNNVELGGDLDRRIYRIALDPKHSQPWTRDGFRHADLDGWAAEHRGELLAALLTLATAWWAAGKPDAPDTPTLGTFQPWATTIAGILHHAGVPGFLGNRAELWAEGNEEAGQWEGFLLALHVTYGDHPFTVADLARSISSGDNGAVAAALPDDLDAHRHTPGFKRELGKAMRRRVDTRHGDRQAHLADVGKAHGNVQAWRVRVLPEATA